MNQFLKKWLNKTSCLSFFDIDSIPKEETVVIYDDGEHFFTVRREKSANIYSIKTINGETVIECMEYLSNGSIETLKYDRNLCHSSLFTFFTQSIRRKGESKDFNKNDPFYEVNQILYHLREHPEYLTDEEYHRVRETLPNDMREMKEIYRSLLSDEKKKAKEYLNDARDTLVSKLNVLKDAVYERKITKMEIKNNVIKKRL